MFSRGLFSARECAGSFLTRILILLGQGPIIRAHLALITSKRALSLTQSDWGLKRQHIAFLGGGHNLVHSRKKREGERGLGRGATGK